MKSEALVFGIVATVIALIACTDDRLRRLRWYLVALLPAIAWLAVAHAYGTHFSADIAPKDLLHAFSARTVHRLGVVTPALLRKIGVITGTSVLALVALWVGTRARPRDQQLDLRQVIRPGALLLLASLLADVAALAFYSIGTRALSQWIPASLSRVVATPIIFALSALVALVPVVTQLISPARKEEVHGSISGSTPLSRDYDEKAMATRSTS
ncbi:MAG: hypothetical protein WAV54_00450 [Acidimicrobiales bacterium]